MANGWQAPPLHVPPRQLWPQVPQLRGSDAVCTHAFEHMVVVPVQVKPHEVALLQMGVAFAGAVQAVHDVVPQLLGLPLETQAPLQL
jgi:hypothetical protein